MNATIEEVIGRLAHIVEIKVREDGTGYVPGYAPDSSDYVDGDQPGGEWDDECNVLIAEVRGELPEGWRAHWLDDDLVVEQIDTYRCRHCGADLTASLARLRALYPGDADPAPYCDDDCAAADRARFWRIGGAL